MLLYSICYYYGKNKKSNLHNHITSFSSVCHQDKTFVLCVMVDSHDVEIHEQIKIELSNYIISINKDIKYELITSFNWGGTIAALWMTYNYSKKIEVNTNELYVSHFEEDFGPFNNEWFNDSVKLLTRDIVYIGETTSGLIKSCDDDGRLSGEMHSFSTRLGDPEVWTDGGYYFSTLDKLTLIENKIGVFHKGGQQSNYIHLLDGIDYGEVGFPTLLYHNNFKFNCLHREKYFINEW